MGRRAYLHRAGTAVAAGVTGVLSGCLGVGSWAVPEYDVGMSTEAFRPESITVTAGETVVWHNTSSHAHTVTAYEATLPDDAAFFASGEFDDEATARDAWANGEGGALYAGDSYEHTFDVPGEYGYFCIPHERAEMVGSVVVEEG